MDDVGAIMETIMDSYTYAFLYAALIALLRGAFVGAIPAICGAIKHKTALAIGGFFACIISSLLFGWIFSILICALFVFLIFFKNNNNNEPEE